MFIFYCIDPTEVQPAGPVDMEEPYREERRGVASFEVEDGDVEEPTERSYVDHYHDKPVNFDYERPSSEHVDDRRDGERWFQERALNINRQPNDIRKHICLIIHRGP